MKNKFLKTVLIGGLALTGFVSVALVNVEAASVYDEYSQSIYQPLSTETNLSVEEMLNYAINDEYMALSEYKAIVEEFGDVMPFVRIISAEETHISTLLNLFVTYGYNVPEDQTQNYVVIPESITAAVATAIEAEEANIAMYETFLAQEDLPDDVRLVFEQLLAASEHHLQAFQADRLSYRSEDAMNQFKNQFRKMFGNGLNGTNSQNRHKKSINIAQ